MIKGQEEVVTTSKCENLNTIGLVCDHYKPIGSLTCEIIAAADRILFSLGNIDSVTNEITDRIIDVRR